MTVTSKSGSKLNGSKVPLGVIATVLLAVVGWLILAENRITTVENRTEEIPPAWFVEDFRDLADAVEDLDTSVEGLDDKIDALLSDLQAHIVAVEAANGR